MFKNVIGVVGGMGSYATCDFFRRLVDAFPAEKEWDRPRIIIDNNCTMPSRVRAILYKEERASLVKLLSESIINLRSIGADKIILACNTSHVFLDEIYEEIEKSTGRKEDCVMNMIEICAESINCKNVKQVSLMATEGTIDSGIYNMYLNKYDIKIAPPSLDNYKEFRYLIECVKQNNIDDESVNRFLKCVAGQKFQDVILGCTEFPVFMRYVKQIPGVTLHDPLDYLIDKLKSEIV